MTRAIKKNALRAVGFAAGMLYSLLSLSHSNATSVDFYFNGLVSPAPNHMTHSRGAESPKRELGRNQLPRTIPSPALSKGDTLVAVSLNIGTPRLLNAAHGDSARLASNQWSDTSLDQMPIVPLQLHDLDFRDQMFSNDQFPSSPPSLSSLTKTQWRIIFEDLEGPAHRVLLSSVSLPASVWLFGTGLVALVGLGSRGILSHKNL